MTTEPTPRITVTIAAPADAVWGALRDKDKIRHWHGWEYEGLDAEIDVIFFTDFEEDPAARRLEVQGGDVFEVHPYEGGARVTLTRAPHGTDPEWDAYYDDVTEGWVTFLHQLRFALERHPDQPRRTLFYAGTGSTAPAAGLGLEHICAGPVGETVETELLGEQVSGNLWFRSEHQCGLSVDGWGDGLLILSHLPPSVAKPSGAAMAILTLYGMDDVEVAVVNDRWQAWWSAHHPMGQPAATP